MNGNNGKPGKGVDTTTRVTLDRQPIEREGPAYVHRAPIAEKSRKDDVVKRMLDTDITITVGDMLNVSDPVREELKNLVSKKRQASKKTVFAGPSVQAEKQAGALSMKVEATGAKKLSPNAMRVEDLPPIAAFLTADAVARCGLPKGSLVQNDPVLHYYNSLGDDEIPRQLYVAKESQALRSFYPLINGSIKEESIYDCGSQLVSMDVDVACEAGLAWDPDIKILLQSANNQVEPTLGLAKNVPFVFGDITIYLQVHIVKGPAYKVLVGRPFDTLTESEVKNRRDGSQDITITCPNTGRRCTVPTVPRGQPPRILHRQPNVPTTENF